MVLRLKLNGDVPCFFFFFFFFFLFCFMVNIQKLVICLPSHGEKKCIYFFYFIVNIPELTICLPCHGGGNEKKSIFCFIADNEKLVICLPSQGKMIFFVGTVVKFTQLCSKFPPTALLDFACDWLAFDRYISFGRLTSPNV